MSEKDDKYIYLDNHSYEKTWSFVNSWENILAKLKRFIRLGYNQANAETIKRLRRILGK